MEEKRERKEVSNFFFFFKRSIIIPLCEWTNEAAPTNEEAMTDVAAALDN